MNFKGAEKDKILELYSQGDSYKVISEKTGNSLFVIAKWFSNEIKAGRVEKRVRMQGEVLKQEILKMLIQHVERVEIAERLGCSLSTVNTYRAQLAKEGAIPKPARTIKLAVGAFREVESSLEPGKTIHCNKKTSAQCVYGCLNYNAGLCRYILCTGKMRGCETSNCDKFSKISTENPRIVISDY